ncbi:MAG: glutaredoxin family protein [Lentisphaerae bacterium]|nr:glutaredoxin family protein [Lentisphaerota bacterium]MCP4102805.1 glutaredoxin family protein [Lentisphaerota bacterium]
MLHVYAAEWCPHSRDTLKWLDDHKIKYYYHDIEAQPKDIMQMVIEANGGQDWAVPTLMYDEKWRAAKAYDAKELEEDLKELGVIK